VRFLDPPRNAGDSPGDHDSEMLRRDRLDDRTADAVLAGHAGHAPDDALADLAAFVEGVRAEATTGSARPNAMLAAVLAHGISAEKGELPVTAASNVNGPVTQVSGPPKRRTRKMLELITAKLAALSLVAKAGVAGAAVVATSAGAGAAGVLPDTLQGAFDDVVRGSEQSEDVDPAQAGEGGVNGLDVAEDAQNGGVDGQEVAEDASDGRSTVGRDRAEDAQDNAPALPAEADQGLDRAEDGKANAGDLPDAVDGASDSERPAEGQQPDIDAPPVETPAYGGASTAPGTDVGR